jgi:DNA-binding MarR family transcriptional regulator
MSSTEQVTSELFDFAELVMRSTQSGVLRLAGELDLTLSQLRALYVLLLSERPPALTELAPEVGLSTAATGRLVDHLVRLGLVARREDDADRRVKRLSLTDEGHATLARLAAARRDGLRAFAERLGDDDRARLSAALRPILDRSGLPAARQETTTA